ncbi:hypothetical protein [Kingella oralis]|uniref:hypothetical protein n=1 Tax=Kingella oralis TaxID=505 RepID=UPI002D7F389D|nr:hypothetical protein [Kingella oralis]
MPELPEVETTLRGIAPQRAAKSLSKTECAALTAAVKHILCRAIETARGLSKLLPFPPKPKVV